jgi:glucans biosynthesis protein C
MWFVEHLLLFSLVYALLRKFSKSRSVPVQREVSPPGYLPILIFAFLLSVVTFLVRLRFPIDYWVNLLGFFRVAFGDVPRDLSLFIIGILAYRYRWVESFSSKAGRVWLGLGIFLAALCYCYTLVISDVAPISEKAMQLIYPVWESLLCLGLCIGLTILFRDLFNAQGRFGKALADSQYPAYIFHLWVVMIYQFALLNNAATPLTKFALVTLVSIVVTFQSATWCGNRCGCKPVEYRPLRRDPETANQFVFMSIFRLLKPSRSDLKVHELVEAFK